MKELIKKHLIEAMKSKNKVVRDLLRYINSEIAKKEKDSGKELDDNGIISIIKKEIKSIKENIQIGIDNHYAMNYFELNEKVEFLTSLLPKQLSEEEVKAEVDKLFEAYRFVDMKVAMKIIIPALGAIADKAMLSKLVKEKF